MEAGLLDVPEMMGGKSMYTSNPFVSGNIACHVYALRVKCRVYPPVREQRQGRSELLPREQLCLLRDSGKET